MQTLGLLNMVNKFHIDLSSYMCKPDFNKIFFWKSDDEYHIVLDKL